MGIKSRQYQASVLLCAALLISLQPALAQFVQQGPKLVGTGAVGRASQGTSVALSGNGDTALIGGPGDDRSMGAVWVFVKKPKKHHKKP